MKLELFLIAMFATLAFISQSTLMCTIFGINIGICLAKIALHLSKSGGTRENSLLRAALEKSEATLKALGLSAACGWEADDEGAGTKDRD